MGKWYYNYREKSEVIYDSILLTIERRRKSVKNPLSKSLVSNSKNFKYSWQLCTFYQAKSPLALILETLVYNIV